MDFKFKKNPDDACDTTIVENEYELELKFVSLVLNDESVEKAQLLFLYGDMLSKMDVNVPKGDETFETTTKSYTIHSTPNALAEKFQMVPIIFLLVNAEDQKLIGSPIILEVNECFCNSVKCIDFKEQSLKKECDLIFGDQCVGKISLIFTVKKDIPNSNRYRQFYTESSAEKAKLQKQMPKIDP